MIGEESAGLEELIAAWPTLDERSAAAEVRFSCRIGAVGHPPQ
jgi:hypothetical protein